MGLATLVDSAVVGEPLTFREHHIHFSPGIDHGSYEYVVTWHGLQKLDVYSGDEEVWKRVCERDDIDLIYICTDWKSHTPIALSVISLENGSRPVEVPDFTRGAWDRLPGFSYAFAK